MTISGSESIFLSLLANFITPKNIPATINPYPLNISDIYFYEEYYSIQFIILHIHKLYSHTYTISNMNRKFFQYLQTSTSYTF